MSLCDQLRLLLDSGIANFRSCQKDYVLHLACALHVLRALLMPYQALQSIDVDHLTRIIRTQPVYFRDRAAHQAAPHISPNSPVSLLSSSLVGHEVREEVEVVSSHALMRSQRVGWAIWVILVIVRCLLHSQDAHKDPSSPIILCGFAAFCSWIMEYWWELVISKGIRLKIAVLSPG